MKDIDFESIGKKLKEIRLSKGLPQDAVASAAERESLPAYTYLYM